jgi:hypothetical protein
MGRYNDRIRALGGNKRGKRKFLRLFTNVKRSVNYHGLSNYARCLLYELIDRYTGINNGFIGLGTREASYELGCSHGTIVSAMRELDDAGLAHPTKLGSRLGKKATEWRLTFLLCNKTGELAVNEWTQRPTYHEVSQESSKGQPGKHRVVVRSATKAQTPNSSMNGPTVRSVGEAHIDIYQGPGGTAELTPEGRVLATSLAKTESNQQGQTNVGLSAKPKSTSKKGAA